MMAPSGSEQCHQNVMPPPYDILSNLPENVIDAIVMCLPLRDAVRTSILSKKWRYNWCRLSQLTLDYQTLRATRQGRQFPSIMCKKILDHLLTLHAGPITMFTLSIPCLENCPNIDDLISFLSRNGIRHLVLHLPEGDLYKLPSSLFACMQMTHLTLDNCLIRPPPDFKGFDRLISLELREVSLSWKLLESLISHCPLLEQLDLDIPDILEHITISAPKLRSFNFTGSTNSFCLKSCSLLVYLSLVHTGSYVTTGQFDGAKFFESFPDLEHLELSYLYVELFAAGTGGVPTRLSSVLNCLKHLVLYDICLGDTVDASYALCLIISSPCLQHIEFEVYHEASPSLEIASLEALQVEGFCDVTLNHLRSVRLTGISGTRPEMEFVKLLLAKSPVLLRMLIERRRVGDKSTVRMLAELTQFRRASPEAEVVCETMK